MMFKFGKNINQKKQGYTCRQAGMTYVELIVVLSIFSVMTSVVLFNYNKFEDKIDIKVLANDIALKIVEAQKSALSGKLPAIPPADWKPSYGINFDTSSIDEKKKFTFFTNFNNDFYDASDSVLDQPIITKSNTISKLEAMGCSPTQVDNISIVFKRPSSRALIASDGLSLACASSVQITVSSPELINSVIEVYSSGRVQIN